MPKPAKHWWLPAVVGLLVSSSASISVWAADPPDYSGWYQVDVILFKPRNTNLDAESWPEPAFSFPANMVSVTEPDPFNLSLLEQAYADMAFAVDETPVEPVLRRDEFKFQQESRSDYNRRLLASLSSPAADSNSTTDGRADPVGEETQTDGEKLPDADGGSTDHAADATSTSSEAPFSEPLSFEPTPGSFGQLAFSTSLADSSLRRINSSLRRSSRYDVLDHLSWIQPINSEPTPVLVQAGQRYDDRYELEGTLSIYRSRFLHVQTDLWYTLFEPRGTSGALPNAFQSTLPDEVLKEYADLVEVERQRGQYYPARSHVMKQSRRMRSDELHYIDHPLFGVIVRINRFQPEA